MTTTCQLLVLFAVLMGFAYSSQMPEPGDLVKTFQLPTLRGKYRYEGSGPVVLHAYDSRSLFLQAMWSDDSSLAGFLLNSPFDTQYVFMTFDEDATSTVQWFYNRLKSVQAALDARAGVSSKPQLGESHFFSTTRSSSMSQLGICR